MREEFMVFGCLEVLDQNGPWSGRFFSWRWPGVQADRLARSSWQRRYEGHPI